MIQQDFHFDCPTENMMNQDSSMSRFRFECDIPCSISEVKHLEAENHQHGGHIHSTLHAFNPTTSQINIIIYNIIFVCGNSVPMMEIVRNF